ncbi:hypothetical protein H1R20_g16027, partial [Candolleomyces eurysporus]
METVLQLPDLLNPIFQNFRVLPPNSDPDSGERYPHFSRDDLISNEEKRTTLYRLALTNKAISQIALPILWSTLGGIEPLLKLIPGAEFSAAHRTWDVLSLEYLQKLTFDFEEPLWPVNHQKRHQFLNDLNVRLPRLRKLDLGDLLEDNDHTISPWLEPGLATYHFPSLEDLAFSGGDDYLAKVLLRLRGVGLKSLVFWSSEPCSGVGSLAVDEAEDQEIEKFSAYKAMLILGEQHFRTLTRLEIDGLRTEHFHPGDLDPLLRISGMKHLDFHHARNIQIDDELISKMASSWPHLETFRLYSDSTSTCPTLASIQTFARHCPNLRRLSLDLDLKVVPLEDTQTILALRHLTLFSVLNDAKIGDDDRVSAIAKFISECFPALLFAFVEPSWNPVGEPRTWSSVFDRVLQDKDAKITERLRNIFQPQKTFPKIDFVIPDGVGGSITIPL